MFGEFGTTAVQGNPNEYITYVCVSTPNLKKLKRNFSVIMPYVDRAVVVIGRRDEETENFLAGQKNTTIVYRPWTDSFRDQYQAGLNAVRGGWMLWLDDDEVPSEEMLRSLRDIMLKSSHGTHFDVVSFRCVDVWDGTIGEPSGYYRELFTCWNPTLHFQTHLHQYMAGKSRGARCDLTYYHHKSTEGSMRGSCRNYFIGGVWADHKESFEYWFKETGQDPRPNAGAPLVPVSENPPYPVIDGFKIDAWYNLKDILKRNHPEVQYYNDLDKLIRDGSICQEFRDWAFKHNADNDTRPHLGEQHVFDKYIKYCDEKRAK